MNTHKIQLFQILPQIWRGKYNGEWITSEGGRDPVQVCCTDAGEAQKMLAEVYKERRKERNGGWIF